MTSWRIVEVIQALMAENERLREEVKIQNGWAHDQLREVERLRNLLTDTQHD